MNRTYIESYYERYKDADFVADFIKEEMKLGYEWLKSRSDREEIVEEIVNCRVKFVKYLKIIDIMDRKDKPRIHAWQWIMIEYKAISNYVLTGNCAFSCFGEENEPEMYHNFDGKEIYLGGVQRGYHQWLLQSYSDPNAIVRLVK